MDEALLECYQSLRMSGEQRSSWSESFILFLPAQFAPKAPKLLKWEISCILGYFFLELQLERLNRSGKSAGERSTLFFPHCMDTVIEKCADDDLQTIYKRTTLSNRLKKIRQLG